MIDVCEHGFLKRSCEVRGEWKPRALEAEEWVKRLTEQTTLPTLAHALQLCVLRYRARTLNEVESEAVRSMHLDIIALRQQIPEDPKVGIIEVPE